MRLNNIFTYLKICTFILLIICLFYFTNFKFGNFDNFIENKTQLFFNIIILLFCIYFFISFYISKEKNIIIGISTFSILISIFIIEAYLQYKHLEFIKGDLSKKKNIYKSKTGKTYDERSKFEYYQELKKKHFKLSFPITIPMVLASEEYKRENFLPFSGISNIKTIHCNENGYYSTYESDRFGFNNEDSIWDSTANKKIILLGDSFVHGACVFRKDSISGFLKGLNDKVEFYNLSYSEHGPLEQLAVLKEYSKIIKPNYIIWFYFEGNDLGDLSGSLNNKVLRSYLENENFSQNLIEKTSLSDQLYKSILDDQIKKQEIKFHTFTFNFESFFKLSYFRKTFLNLFIKPEPPIKEFKKIAEQILKFAKKNDSKLYVVYLPDYHRYYYKKDKDLTYLNYEKVLNTFKTLDLKVIDINKELSLKIENKKELFPFEKFGHYNEIGYKLISTIINEKIFKN